MCINFFQYKFLFLIPLVTETKFITLNCSRVVTLQFSGVPLKTSQPVEFIS